MTETIQEKPPVFGFMGIVHVPDLGHCGGYLMVNSLGRPVEFHCTAPVTENRAEQILFGQTYSSYLYCDQIGKALLDKAKKTARLIFVNDPRLDGIKQHAAAPILLVSEKSTEASRQPQLEIEEFPLTILTGQENSSLIKSLCLSLAKSIPLDEPFERITQAIDEAQAVVR